MGFCNCSVLLCVTCVHSSFAIISMGKRELVALLCLSSWCLVIVVWLFLMLPRVCLQLVIVVFPDHTHLLFLQTEQTQIRSTLFAYGIMIRYDSTLMDLTSNVFVLCTNVKVFFMNNSFVGGDSMNIHGGNC